MEERRAHPRFKVKMGAYAAFRPFSAKRGQIVDISRGGLAFHYIAAARRSGKERLAILVNGSGVFLDGIPCATVSDIRIGNSSPFITMPLRRCGVRFLDMPLEKIQHLDQFIREYTY